MNILQEIEILKQKIAELEKELEKVGNEGEKKYPAEGTRVYFVTAYGGTTYHTWGYWSNEETEKRIKSALDSGERFLTKEDAEEYAEVKQIERELYALADDDKEWDTDNPHWCLYYSYNNFLCYVTCEYSSRENIPYFVSEESAKKAIEAVGEDRVIKWLTYQRKRPQI